MKKTRRLPSSVVERVISFFIFLFCSLAVGEAVLALPAAEDATSKSQTPTPVALTNSLRSEAPAIKGFSDHRIEWTRSTRPRVPPGTEVPPKIVFRVITIDPKLVQISMRWKKTDGKPFALLSDLRDVMILKDERFLFATNGGIYDKSYRPLGLYIENAKLLRPINRSRAPGGNFSMVPNGIFILRGYGSTSGEVIDSTEYESPAGIQFATQSGPLLLRHGKFHPGFKPDSANFKLRSGVGINSRNEIVFAISEGFTSFYEFANFYKTELHCDDALYLDGTISEFLVGLEAASSQFVPFAGMITATLREGNKASH